jgi:hypothetical protein
MVGAGVVVLALSHFLYHPQKTGARKPRCGCQPALVAAEGIVFRLLSLLLMADRSSVPQVETTFGCEATKRPIINREMWVIHGRQK